MIPRSKFKVYRFSNTFSRVCIVSPGFTGLANFRLPMPRKAISVSS
jgi:hypothetical protein